MTAADHATVNYATVVQGHDGEMAVLDHDGAREALDGAQWSLVRTVVVAVLCLTVVLFPQSMWHVRLP